MTRLFLVIDKPGMDDQELFGGLSVEHAVSKLRTKPQKFQSKNKWQVSPKDARTWRGKVYDSKLEMRMHQELLEHFPEDYVTHQARFILQPSYCLDYVKDKQRALVYTSDFVLGKLEGKEGDYIPGIGCMILDAKGVILPAFVMAAKLFEYRHRIPIIAVSSMTRLKHYISEHKKSMNVNNKHVEIITRGKPFWVRDYTDSDGNVSDLLVEVIGRDGYLNLVRDSKTKLADLTVDLLEVQADELATMREAYEKVSASLDKKLGEVEEESAARRNSTETYSPISPDLVIVNGDPEKLAVMRLRLLEQTCKEECGKKANSKGVTLWRKKIESQLPISEYRHRLNLYPGKFSELQPA